MADTMNLLEWKLRLAELFDAYVTKDAEREDGDAEAEEVAEIYEALRDHIRTDPVLSGSAQPSPPADAALADRITPSLIIHYGQVQHENEKLREEIAALRARAVPDGMTAVYEQMEEWLDSIRAGNIGKVDAGIRALLAASKEGT